MKPKSVISCWRTGRVYEGYAIGRGRHERVGEVVFQHRHDRLSGGAAPTRPISGRL